MAKDLIIRSSAEEFITFKVQEKDKGIQVRYENETLWMTQKAMAELFNVEQPAIAKHLINIYNENSDLNEKNFYPAAASLTPEEASEYGSTMNEINTYRYEMLVKFLLGTEPIENYDKFVQTMNDLGMQRVLEIKQAAYDRYNNR